MEKLFSQLDAVRDEALKVLQEEEANLPPLYTAHKRNALKNYTQISVPSSKEKEWTRIATLDQPADTLRLAPRPKSTLHNTKLPASSGEFAPDGRVVISEEQVEFWLNSHLVGKGVILCDTVCAWEKHGDLLSRNCLYAKNDRQEKIHLLTECAHRHGFFLYVPGGISPQPKFEIIIRSNQGGLFFPISAVLHLGKQAEATVFLRLESAADVDELVSMNLSVNLEDSARLVFLENQKMNQKTWVFTHESVHLGLQARLDYMLLEAAAKMSKRMLEVSLHGEGSQAQVTGIYQPQKEQVVVFDTHQNHLGSHSISDLLFNGVIADDAYSLWQGNVYVAAGTRGADGFQTNRNILMSPAAHAESIPGLEILADDVRCSHGVTLGNVDAEQVYYLQSRGIPQEEARKMIVSGFLQSAAARMHDNALLKIAQNELQIENFDL